MGSSKTSTDLGRLESLLGFRFRDPSLFQTALTHRSFCNEHDLPASVSYERLEFLGDAVLELTVSEELYRVFPDFPEGRLTTIRSSLVRGPTLAGVARRMDLGGMLLVGKGVEISGGRQQESILAAAFEALVAAVYLDQGSDVAKEFLLRMMAGEFAEYAGAGPNGRSPDNPKGRLQEHVQGLGLQTPDYHLVGSEGPDHGPVFTVEVVLNGEVIGTGRGGRKSEAEVEAARHALAALEAVG